MKKVILFMMTMSMLNASYYSICKRDRDRLRHAVYDKEQEIKKLHKKLYNMERQLQHETKQNIKLRNELERVKNASNRKSMSYGRQMQEKYRAEQALKRDLQIENKQPTKEQLQSKSYQKNLIWYKRRFEECKASLEVL